MCRSVKVCETWPYCRSAEIAFGESSQWNSLMTDRTKGLEGRGEKLCGGPGGQGGPPKASTGLYLLSPPPRLQASCLPHQLCPPCPLLVPISRCWSDLVPTPQVALVVPLSPPECAPLPSHLHPPPDLLSGINAPQGASLPYSPLGLHERHRSPAAPTPRGRPAQDSGLSSPLFRTSAAENQGQS